MEDCWKKINETITIYNSTQPLHRAICLPNLWLMFWLLFIQFLNRQDVRKGNRSKNSADIHRWTCLFTWTSKLVSNSWNIFVYFQVWSLTNIYLEHHSSFSVVWKLLDISEKSLDVLYMLWTPNIWIVWICKQFANF